MTEYLRWVRLLPMGALFFMLACGDTVEAGGGTPSDEDAGGAGGDAGGSAAPSAAVADLRLEDDAGNRWRITGEGLDGVGDLDSVAGHNAFWFAWSVFHPGTSIFGRDHDIQGEPVEGTGECTVPCDEIAPACSGIDCIPSLESPTMVSTDDPSLGYLADQDEVLGVLTPAGPRAYPHNILWWHEIVNEAVDGQSFAVTFCPLTGSGLHYDRAGFVDGEVVELGVSGNLYNSNLTMYDRTSETWWNQMRVEAVFGPEKGERAPLLPVYEMTWSAWRALFPDTLVVSSDTGHSRDYTRYPYGSYRTDDSNTFRTTNPAPDPTFGNKDMTFGLFAGGAYRAYPWQVLEETAGGRQGLVEDELGGVPVAIAFDLDSRYVHAFDRRLDDATLTLRLIVPEG